jgi:hypothetical protein
MKTLTASDKLALVRLASSLPVGSSERKAILAGLSEVPSSRKASSSEALELLNSKIVGALYLASQGVDPVSRTAERLNMHALIVKWGKWDNSWARFYKHADLPNIFRDIGVSGGEEVAKAISILKGATTRLQNMSPYDLKNTEEGKKLEASVEASALRAAAKLPSASVPSNWPVWPK